MKTPRLSTGAQIPKGSEAVANEAHFHWFGQLRSTSNDGDGHIHNVEPSTGKTHRSSPPRESDGDHVHSIVFGARTVVSGPAVRQGKLAVSEMVPVRLQRANDIEIALMERKLRKLFIVNFATNRESTVGDLDKEDIVKTASFVWQEMRHRGMPVDDETALWREAKGIGKDAEEEPVEWIRDEIYNGELF